jgi:hypothetical protein
MDDGLEMRVLHPIAHFDEQLQPLTDAHPLLIAISSDGQAGHILHHKVRLAVWSRAGIEDLGDRGMVHDGQRLPLGLEALQHPLVVHSDLDEF